MTNKLVVIINSLKVPKIEKILLYEMKFIVPNYSSLQNPWIGGYAPRPRSLCPLSSTEFVEPPPTRKKCLGTPLLSVPFFIQQSKHMRRIIFSSVACLDLPLIARLPHKRHDLRKTGTDHNFFFFNFSSTCVWNISHSKKNSARHYHKRTQVFMNRTCHSCPNLSFLDRFSKNTQISNFVKSIQREMNCSMPADGRIDRQTGMTKLIVAFRNFASAPKKSNKELLLDSSSLYLKPHNPKHETCLCYLTILSVTEVIQNMWNVGELKNS